LMVIKVTVAPTGTYAVFVYQTGYIWSSIHPWVRDDYTLHHTPNCLSRKYIYDMIDMLWISVASSTSKSPIHNGKKISGSFKKWVCEGHELNLGCVLCMGFPH
jgi:hypothetical protein